MRLHDLSASLLDPTKLITLQLYKPAKNMFVSFLPLSEEADQQMLWNLIRVAKTLRKELLAFYDLVRSYRAQMTRIKLASDYDLGVTFDAVRSDRAHLLFKLKYQPGVFKERSAKKNHRDWAKQYVIWQTNLPVWREYLHDQALHFKKILQTAREIVPEYKTETQTTKL